MNTRRRWVAKVTVAGVVLGMAAGLTLPRLDVTLPRLDGIYAGTAPPDSQPATEPTEATSDTVETTAPEPTAPATTDLETTAPPTSVDTTVTSVAADGSEPPDVGPLGPDDTYGVTVEAVCLGGTTPAANFTSTSTADIRVALGPAAMVLTVAQPTWRAPWPIISDDGGDSPDPAPQWTAARLDTEEVFDLGTLTLPADCPSPPSTVPSAITSLAAAYTTLPGQVRLTWTAPFDGGRPVSDYIIHRSPNGVDGWTLVDDGISTETAFVVTGLTNGTRYWFRVAPVNDVGTGPVSNIASEVPRGVPSPPRSLIATTTNLSGQVRLTWTSPLTDGGFALTDYVIQRSPDNGLSWVTINDGVSAATTYTVTGLTNGTRVHFRVLAKNVRGTSIGSGVVIGFARSVPAPPSLTAAATGASGQVVLNWATLPPSGSPIQAHVIQRSTNGTTGWVTISNRLLLGNGYTVNGLTNGTRYYFRVLVRNSVGTGSPSNTASAIPRNVLTAPRALTALPTNVSGRIQLQWGVPLSNGGRAITDYVIQRSSNGWSGWVTIPDGIGVGTFFHVNGLTNGARYHFRVVAKTGTITSPASNVANATPIARPSAPVGFQAGTNFDGYYVTWRTPTSNGGTPITAYRIQTNTSGTWVTRLNVASAVRSAFITLPGYGCADLRIAAYNAAGFGTWSYVIDSCFGVPSAPTGLSGQSFAWGYSLDWSAPASTGGSPITDYVVQARVTGDWFTVDEAVSVATWTNLGPHIGCVYFRVAARTARGDGPFGPAIRIC
jgi:hypothetical protein